MALTGIEEFILFGFVPLMFGVLATPARKDKVRSVVTGRIVIPPSRPLPESATVTIELVEQRRGETVLPVVAYQAVRWRGGGVQKFTLPFDRSEISSLAFYAVRARIIVGSAVLFETRHPQLAAPLSDAAVTLMLTATTDVA